MNIIIADDHTLVRRGIIQLIRDGVKDIDIVDEASDGNELFEHLRSRSYDLILLDINLPGQNGLEILKQLKLRFPKIPVLILSMYTEEQYALRSIRSGASGYITKESAPEELVEAILRVVSGKYYVSSAMMDSVIMEIGNKRTAEPHEILSDREFDVMNRIARGESLSYIAESLSLSVKTVSTYRKRILEKTCFKNNTEITLYAKEKGLI